MAGISNLVYTDKFKKWFDTTNTIITTLNGITVYQLLSGDGVGVTSSGNVFTVSHAPTVSTGVTFSGNVNFTGLVTFTNNPSSNSTTVINVSPKINGITSGHVVRITPTGLTLAKADSAVNAEVFGVVVSETASAHTVAVSGLLDNTLFANTIQNVVGTTLIAGQAYFLDYTVAGGITVNEPQNYGYVSKPVLLGVTSNAGSILTYRGVLLEGISYGITAELDNKLIVEIDYGTGKSVSGNSVKIGDPICYLEDTVTSESTINGYNVLGNKLKAWGKINNSTYDTGFVLDMSNWTDSTILTGKLFLGLVSKIIQNVGSKYLLEVVLPGGTITATVSNLDSAFYTENTITSPLNLNTNAKLVKSTSSSKFVDFIKLNDVDNTVKIVLSSGVGGSPQGTSSGSTPSGLTAGLEYYNLIPNGAFTVWQRPAPIYDTSYNASASYTTSYLLQPAQRYDSDGGGVFTYYWHKFIDPLADRWFVIRDLPSFTYLDGGNTRKGLTGEVIRQSFASDQSEVPGSPLYYVNCKFVYTLSPVAINKRPRLENIQANARLAQNQRVTYSFWAKSTVSGATIDIIYNRYKEGYPTGIGFTADLEGRVNVTNTSGGITLSTLWKQYKRSFNIGAAGFTLQDTDLGWFGIGFEFPSSSATISLAQTQLQLGNETNEPVHVLYDDELKRCKQIFQTSFEQGVTFVYSGIMNRKGPANRPTSSWKNAGTAQVFATTGNIFRYPVEMLRGISGIIGNPVNANSNFQIFSLRNGTHGHVTVTPFTPNWAEDSDQISSSKYQLLPWQDSNFNNTGTYTKPRSSNTFSILPGFAGKTSLDFQVQNNNIVPFDTLKFEYILDADITSSIYIPGFATRYSSNKIYL